MRIDPNVELPPTENLIVEVLVARYRLGEKTWAFDSSVGKPMSSLIKKGYVRQSEKQPKNVIIVGLTDEAISMNLTYDYIPSIAKGNPEMEAAFRSVTEEAQGLKQKLSGKAQPRKKPSPTQDEGATNLAPPASPNGIAFIDRDIAPKGAHVNAQ